MASYNSYVPKVDQEVISEAMSALTNIVVEMSGTGHPDDAVAASPQKLWGWLVDHLNLSQVVKFVNDWNTHGADAEIDLTLRGGGRSKKRRSKKKSKRRKSKRRKKTKRKKRKSKLK